MLLLVALLAQAPVVLTPGMVITRSVRVAPRVYRFTGAPIVIRGDNITVDFAGATLQGADSTADPDQAATTLWTNNNAQFWEVTQCQWQKRLDPAYDTYGPAFTGPRDYDFAARTLTNPEVQQNLAAFETTGKIKAPLITLAGTMDALLPIQTQAREYAGKVAASRNGNNDERAAQYRLYEIQNGNHTES